MHVFCKMLWPMYVTDVDLLWHVGQNILMNKFCAWGCLLQPAPKHSFETLLVLVVDPTVEGGPSCYCATPQPIFQEILHSVLTDKGAAAHCLGKWRGEIVSLGLPAHSVTNCDAPQGRGSAWPCGCSLLLPSAAQVTYCACAPATEGPLRPGHTHWWPRARPRRWGTLAQSGRARTRAGRPAALRPARRQRGRTTVPSRYCVQEVCS